MCRPRVASSSTATASTPVSGCRRRRPAPPPTTPAASAPSATPDHRQRGQRAPAERPPLRTGSTVPNAKAAVSERITASDRTLGRSLRPRRTWPSTPGWPPRPAAPAARPPRRCPRRGACRGRRSARAPAAASASVCAGSVDRWPACHHCRAPGASRSATSAAAVTTTPSSSSGVRRTAACAQKPAIAARSAPPQTRSRPSGSAMTTAGPVQRVADGRGLARPARVVDTGAAADHRDRLGVGQRGDQSRCGRGVSDAHVAGDQQVGAARRPPRRRCRRPGLDRRPAPRRRSARPRRRCCRCPGAPCARRSTRESGSSDVDRDVGHPHARARDLGQHVDRGAAGVEVGDHLRGDLGGKRRHARAR